MHVEGYVSKIASEALDEILHYCADASIARENAEEGSPEWYKRTGEILGYAKMTYVLDKLQRQTQGSSLY